VKQKITLLIVALATVAIAALVILRPEPPPATQLEPQLPEKEMKAPPNVKKARQLWDQVQASGASEQVSPPSPTAPGLPPKLQAALFKKIFELDTTLSSRGGTERLFVVAGTAQADASRALGEAFKAAGVAKEVLAADPESPLPGLKEGDALYLASASHAEAAKGLTTAKVLSVSGEASLAEKGIVAVGLGVTQEGRPEIVLNKKRLTEQGHAFEPKFFEYARVIE